METSHKLQKLIDTAIATKDKLERQIYAAAVISSAFEKKGIQTVLVGGAVVEYYTAGGYTTLTLI